METKKYRHFLVTRILPGSKHDHHEKDYTAFLTRFFYDPDSRKTYYDLYDPLDPIPVGDGYLFAEIEYKRLDLHEVITQDFTELRPYPLPEGKKYDPPRGSKLCAEYNALEYHKAYTRWINLREQAKEPPISDRLSDLLAYYERILYDTKRWFRENCPSDEIPSDVPVEKLLDLSDEDGLDIKCSDDYTTINKGGKLYYLTPPQAVAFRILLRAHKNQTPAVHEQFILNEIDTKSKHLSDVFKSRSEAWDTFIMKGKTKGSFQIKT